MRNNHATKTSQSGTFAIGTLPPAAPLPSDLIAEELRQRLASMPTEALVQLLQGSTTMPPAAPASTATTFTPAPTVRALVRRVLGRNALPSQEVVRQVQTLRPGTPAPTVRSDLSRMRAEGELRAVGPVRGGKLRIA